MPYVTSFEQIGHERGLAEGIHIGEVEGLRRGLALEFRFGAKGTALLTDLQQIDDPARLQAIGEQMRRVESVEELRRLMQSDR